MVSNSPAYFTGKKIILEKKWQRERERDNFFKAKSSLLIKVTTNSLIKQSRWLR
jgi:hypothetical protein